jgi:hypothetical protein
MQAAILTKFGFRIRTRVGVVVDSLVIQGRDEDDAMRKLRQMYIGCEIIECMPVREELRMQAATFEEVAGLITR